MAECVHEWGPWEKILWYTPKGRFVGEARKCSKCSVVETRNVEVDPRPAVLQPTIGVFAGIFSKDGKLLVKRITSGRFVGEYDLPGGGIAAVNASKARDERVIGEELRREVEGETGVEIPTPQPMPAMYPAVIAGGGDWAFTILIGVAEQSPTKGEWKYVSPQELRELADGPEGNRLLSGPGKRMHRLCLRLMASRDNPNPEYRKQAGAMLAEIQRKWDS